MRKQYEGKVEQARRELIADIRTGIVGLLDSGCTYVDIKSDSTAFYTIENGKLFTYVWYQPQRRRLPKEITPKKMTIDDYGTESLFAMAEKIEQARGK